MVETAAHQSKNVSVQVSHVTETEVVLQVRERISKRHDRLNWISISRAELPGLLDDLASAPDRDRLGAVANGGPREAAIRLVSDNAAMPVH